MGEDLDAGPLWLDYVTFLKKSEAAHVSPDAKADQADSARMQEVRRAGGVLITSTPPTLHLLALLRAYV